MGSCYGETQRDEQQRLGLNSDENWGVGWHGFAQTWTGIRNSEVPLCVIFRVSKQLDQGRLVRGEE